MEGYADDGSRGVVRGRRREFDVHCRVERVRWGAMTVSLVVVCVEEDATIL